MAGSLDDEWLQKFESLRAETTVNLQPPEDQPVRLCPDILQFIAAKGESFEDLLRRPIICPPRVDDSFPLTSYFISSSHNTYLLAQQILGRSSAASYTHVLSRNGRCVEIDVWQSSTHGYVVTHGHTLSTSVPFQSVCVAINDAVLDDHWPVLVSLECHVPEEAQIGLVAIMKGAWGDKLIDGPLEGDNNATITPKDIMGKILLMVEYYPAEKVGEEHSSENSSDESAVEEAVGEQSSLHWKHMHSKISSALAAIGFYARSMKPPKNWLTEQFSTPPHPSHILINISESSLLKLLPTSLTSLIQHAQINLRRIYPNGTRIGSSNLDPLKFWANGSQIASLNWQHYDRSMQINEALFVGSPGWVLKPAQLLGMGDRMASRLKFVGEIVGISSLLPPKNDRNVSAYIRAELFCSDANQEWKSRVVKVKDVPDTGADIMWNERFEWEYDAEALAFIRISALQSELGKDDHLAVFCARVDHLQQAWRLIPLLDIRGKNSGATALVHFQILVM